MFHLSSKPLSPSEAPSTCHLKAYYNFMDQTHVSDINGISEPNFYDVTSIADVCSHPRVNVGGYDPYIFTGDLCVVCDFLNFLRKSIAEYRTWVCDKAVCKVFNINYVFHNANLINFYRSYDSCDSGVFFSIPMCRYISHFHGNLVEEPPANSSRARARFLELDIANYRCPHSTTGCRAGSTEFPREDDSSLGVPFGEGNPDTTWSCSCTSCGATMMMSGPFAGYFFFSILCSGKVLREPDCGDFIYTMEKFQLRVPISDLSAEFLSKTMPFLFDGEALSSMCEETTAGQEYESPEFAFEQLKSAAVTTEAELVDRVGFHMCGDGAKCHSWMFHSRSWKFCLQFEGAFNQVLDHMIMGQYIKGVSGRSIRAINVARIFGFNPRISPKLVRSMTQRSLIQRARGPDVEVVVTAHRESGNERVPRDGILGSRPSLSVRTRSVAISSRREEDEDHQRAVDLVTTEEYSPREAQAVQVYREPIERSDDEEEFEQCQGEDAEYGYEVDEDGHMVPIENTESAIGGEGYDSLEEQEYNSDEELHEVPFPPTNYNEKEYLERTEKDAVVAWKEFEESPAGQLHIAKSLTSRLGSVIRCGGRLVASCHRLVDWPIDKMVHLCDESGRFLQGANVGTQLEDGSTVRYYEFITEVWPEFTTEVAKIVEIFYESLNLSHDGFKELYEGMNEFSQELQGFITDVQEVTDSLAEGHNAIVARLNRRAKRENHVSIAKFDDLCANMVKLSDRVTEIMETIELSEGDARKISESYLSVSDAESISRRILEPLKAIQTQHTQELDEFRERIKAVEESLRKMGMESVNIPVSDGIRRAAFGRATARREMDQNSLSLRVGDPRTETAIGGADVLEQTVASTSGTMVDRSIDVLMQSLSASVTLGQFDWNASASSCYVLKQYHLPEAIFVKSPIIKACHQLFQYFACDGIEITVSTVSPISQGGILKVSWDSMSCANRRGYKSGFSISPLESLTIKAGSNCVAQMNVAYESIQTQLSLVGEEVGSLSLGSIVIWPLCKLIASDGSVDKCSVTVACKFKNPHFKMRTTPHVFTMSETFGLGGDLRRGYSGKDIMNREGLIYKGTWKSSDVGRILSLNVHPSIVFGATGFCYPTPLSMISNLFGFYKGSLVYTFHFGTNIFCTGRLFFISLGGQHLLKDPTWEQVRDLPGIIYSLSMDSNSFEVVVPYSGVSTHQTVRRNLIFDAGYQGEDLKSRLHVFVQDGLVSNVGSSSEIDFVVTIKAGKDFELSMPRNISVGTTSLLSPQAFMTSMDVSSRISFHSGESHHVLIAGYGYLWEHIFKRGMALEFLCAPLLRSTDVTVNPLSWLSSMFVRWRGSLMYKLQVNVHDRTKAKKLLIWFIPEPILNQKKEMVKTDNGISPPSGENVLLWDPCVSNEFTFTVHFSSRFPNLMIPHCEYSEDMIFEPAFYSGSVRMRYIGEEDVTVKCFVRGGDDMEFFDPGPLPRMTASEKPCKIPYIDSISRVHELMTTKDKTLEQALGETSTSTRVTANRESYTEVIEVVDVSDEEQEKVFDANLEKEVLSDKCRQSSVRKDPILKKGKAVACNLDPKVQDDLMAELAIIMSGKKKLEELEAKQLPRFACRKRRTQVKSKFKKKNKLIEERKKFLKLKLKWNPEEYKGIREGIMSFAASWLVAPEKTAALDKINLDTCVDNINKLNEKENFDKFLKLLEKSEKVDFEKMTQLVDHMNPVVDEFKTNEKLQNGVKNDIPNILEGLGRLTSFGTTLLGYFQGLIAGSFPGFVNEMMKEEKYGTAIICTILGLLALCAWYRAKDCMSLTTKIVTLVTVIWAPLLGSKVLDLGMWLREYFTASMNESLKELNDKNVISTDERNKWCVAGKGKKEFGKDGIMSLLDSFGSLVQPLLYLGLGLTSVVTLGMLPGAKQTTTFTEKFCNFSSKCKNLSGIGSGMKLIHEFCTMFSTKIIGWINWMMGSKALQEDCAINILVQFDVPGWVKRVNDLTLEENKFIDINSEDRISEVRGLYDKAMLIQQAMVRVSIPASLSGVLRDTVSKCRDLLNDTHTCKGLGQTRIDPFHICFFGAPGVGKSACSSIVQRDILDHCGYPKADRSYSRNPQDRYWSRYYGQPCVEYDDLGAIVGSGDSSDYGELINIKSNKAYPLVMADVAEKGAMFRSHFVFSCTNNKMMDDKSNVRNKEAVYRRRDLLVEVKRAPDAVMDATNPTSGLTYTVLDSLTGEVRTTWTKNYFTRPVGFQVVDFTYDNFILFAKEYADSYIKCQKALVSSLTDNQVKLPGMDPLEVRIQGIKFAAGVADPVEDSGAIVSFGKMEVKAENRSWLDALTKFANKENDEIVEDFSRILTEKEKEVITNSNEYTTAEKIAKLQAVAEKKRVKPEDDIELSIDDMVTCYNTRNYKASDLYEQMGTIDNFWLHNLQSCREKRFQDHLRTICSCVPGEPAQLRGQCDSGLLCDVVLNCNTLRKIGVKLCVNVKGKIVLKNVSGSVVEMPACYSSFIVLLNAVQLTSASGKYCPFSAFLTKDLVITRDECGVQEVFVDAEEKGSTNFLDITQKVTKESGCVKCFQWRDVATYYPDLVREYGALYVKDHESVYAMTDKGVCISQDAVDDFNASKCINDLLNGKDKQFFVNFEQEVPQMDLLYFRDSLRDVGMVNNHMVLNEKQIKIFKKSKEIFGETGLYVLWLLMVFARSRNILKKVIKESESEVRRSSCEAALVAYKNVEKEMTDGTSSAMKTTLAIGGAMLGLAAFAGVIYGAIKLFGFLFSSGENDSTDDKLKKLLDFDPLKVPDANDIKKLDEVYVQMNGTIKAEGLEESADNKTRYARETNTGKNWKAPTPKRNQKANKESQTVSKKKQANKVAQIKKLKEQIAQLQGEESMETNGAAEASLFQRGLSQSFKGLIERNGTISEAVVEKMNLTAEDISERDKARDMNTNWQVRMREKKQVIDTIFLTEADHVIGKESVVLHGAGEFAVIPKSVEYSKKHFFRSEVKIGTEKRHEAIQAVINSGLKEIADEGFEQKVERATIATGGVIKELKEKDKSVMECIDGVITKAAAQLYFPKSGSKGNCVRICGSWILFPAHYLLKVESGDDMVLIFNRHVFKLEYNGKRCALVNSLQDLVLYNCGPRIPLAADIRKHFMTYQDLANYVSGPGYMVFTSYGKNRERVLIEKLEEVRLISPDTKISTVLYNMDSDTCHTMISGLSYPALSMPGFCGSCIMTEQTNHPRKLMGIHVASSGVLAVGYAEIVTQEMLNDVILRFGEVISAVPGAKESLGVVEYGKAESQLVQEPTLLKIEGMLPPKLVPRSVMKTDIVRSPLFGLIGPVKTAPSILGPYDGRLNTRLNPEEQLRGKVDPLIIAVDKYGTTTKEFPYVLVKYVEGHLVKHFKGKDNSLNRRAILNLDEAINGIDDTDFWRGMNMKTSCGWPYVLERKVNEIGKLWCFEEIEAFPSGRPRYEVKFEPLLERIDERLENARQGKRTPTLTVECPKDERRKLNKIYDQVSTRSFTNLPLDLNILFRMYFQDFTVMIMEQRHKSFAKVGINPDSPEWSLLFHQLSEVGEKGFAGDYAKFDGIGPPEIYWSIVDLINKWYDDGEENAMVRHVLLSEAYDRFSLVRDVVVKINQGLPSGFPMTVIFNCMVNYYFLGMAWVDLIGQSKFYDKAGLKSFDEYTRVATYGDDNVVSVCDSALEFYNLRTVAAWLNRYGVTYTDAEKNPIEKSEPWIYLKDASFLKRAFSKLKQSGMLYCAPLDRTSIEEQVHWIRKTPNVWGAMNQNLENALYEASLHGEGYYNDLCKRVNNALRVVHRPVITTSYGDQRVRWWKNHDAVNTRDDALQACIDSVLKGVGKLGTSYVYPDGDVDEFLGIEQYFAPRRIGHVVTLSDAFDREGFGDGDAGVEDPG